MRKTQHHSTCACPFIVQQYCIHVSCDDGFGMQDVWSLIHVLNSNSQKTLDGMIAHQPKFTKDGLLDYMLEFVGCEDDVCVYQQINASLTNHLMTLIARLSSLLIEGHFSTLSIIFNQHCLRRVYLSATSYVVRLLTKQKWQKEKLGNV